MSVSRLVIVGAGQAGAQAVFSLRQWGFDGSITMVGDEPVLPYERPPLSKDFLKGELEESRLFLKTADWYQSHKVELLLNVAAARIDRDRKSVVLTDGRELAYDTLILATGSRPRRLPIDGADLPGVFELRSLADTQRLRAAMTPGLHVAVVGAGYIGLEVAASARSLGLEVTVLETMDRVLARVAGEVVSEFFEAEHRRQGVELRTGVRVAAFEADNTRTQVRLQDGSDVPADLVVLGVGIVPNAELALDCGLRCEDGILVDRDARSSDSDIFAIGDCARRPLVHYERSGRLESVHNAIEQGKLAAAAILGRDRPPEDVPWFWSNQYDLKLQIAGLSEGYDEIVVRGDPAKRRFAAFYLRQGVLLAVDAVQSPMEFMGSRQLIARGTHIHPAALADPHVTMKQIIEAQPW